MWIFLTKDFNNHFGAQRMDLVSLLVSLLIHLHFTLIIFWLIICSFTAAAIPTS